MTRLLSTLLLLWVSVATYSRDIYGYVQDANGKPVAGAEVCVMQKGKGVEAGRVKTDAMGKFGIENVPEDSITLTVQHEAYERKEVTFYAFTCPLKIVLLEKARKLNEAQVSAKSAVIEKEKVTFFPTKRQKNVSNGGYNLLFHMPIAMLRVDPLSKSVTTNLGDGVAMFVNGVKATQTDIQNIRSKDVKAVEYLEQPGDPCFDNARYAVNFVVEQYDHGGYTKLEAQQRYVPNTGAYSVYSHYETGKMTYDLLGSAGYERQSHLGEEAKTDYDFPDLRMSKYDTKTGKLKNRQGYASFRARFSADSMQINNTVGMQINRTPYADYSGTTAILSENMDVFHDMAFDSRKNAKNYGVQWNGNYFFLLKNGFNLSTDLTASYMNNAHDYNYVAHDGQSIFNDIEEDAWNVYLNATLSKQIKKMTVGLNLVSSINGNSIEYRGTTPSDISMKDWYVTPRVTFNFRTKKHRLSGNVGAAYEEVTYNGQRETYFMPKTYFSGGWNINAKSSLSYSFEYSLFGNSLSMKSPNYMMTDPVTAVKGNPDLKNYHYIAPSLSYVFIPGKRGQINVFARWQYFDNPTTYVWEPMEYGENGKMVVRSYTNAGYLSDLRYGVTGVLQLFNNKLFAWVTVSQDYYKQNGPAKLNCMPISVTAQANYYFKNFSFTAYWQKSTETVSMFDRTRRPQIYYVAVNYGNGNFTASLSCRNMFNSSWRTTESLYRSLPVNYSVQNYGDSNHRAFVLSLSYSFSYGKKTNKNDRVGKTGMPSTAIVQ